MTTKTKKTIELVAENIGPITHFEAKLVPGINLLRSENGRGKSTLLNAIARAGGADVTLEPKDGETRGELRMDGGVILSLTRSRSKGKVEASLASVSPLSDLIDPGLRDPKANETRRIQALLQLVDLKVTPETILELCAGDENALDFLEEEDGITALTQLNPVDAAARIHKSLHKRKRQLEDEAQKADGRYQATRVEKPENVVTVPVDEARARHNAAIGDLRVAQESSRQRGLREIEREEIAETLGQRPDTVIVVELVENTAKNLAACQTEIARLEGLLKDARGAESMLKFELASFERDQKQSVQLAADWDRRKAILDSEITGATDADVETARRNVDLMQELLDAAVETEGYIKSLAAANSAREDRDAYTKKAAQYEQLAKSVPSRLAGLLEQAGLPGLTVQDGALHVIGADGELEAFSRLSSGERCRLALPIFVAANPGRICALPQEFFESLDHENAVEIAEIFRAHDVVAVTEVPSSRHDPLRVEVFTGE